MSTTKRVTLAGALAVIAALALLSTAALTGSLPGVQNLNTGQSTQESLSSQSTQGSLSIMLTDPPVTPAGVTKVYVSYSNLMVHVSEAGNDSGWYPVASHGTIELLSSINISQTVGTVKLASGDYNFVKFNVTSAMVTYNGVNYTAFVPSAELKIPIVGGIEVTNSKPSATIIDLQTTVINIGSNSTPEFIIRPVAKAYPVPSSQVTDQTEAQGFRQDLRDQSWWSKLKESYTSNLQITAGSLTASSLSVTVYDSGSHSTVIGLVTVSPLAAFLRTGGNHPDGHMPDSLLNSATFLVLKNGSLVPLRSTFIQAAAAGENQAKESVFQSLFGAVGYNLTAGTSQTFAYNGKFVIGYPLLGVSVPNSVVSSQQYVITVLGSEAVASIVVVAG
jgi:hypothetical protein